MSWILMIIRYSSILVRYIKYFINIVDVWLAFYVIPDYIIVCILRRVWAG